jgi:hypothetical protein
LKDKFIVTDRVHFISSGAFFPGKFRDEKERAVTGSLLEKERPFP